jgi:hypothetical protein
MQSSSSFSEHCKATIDKLKMVGKMECKWEGGTKKYMKTKEQKNRNKLIRKPQSRTELQKNTTLKGLKKTQNVSNELTEAFMQEGADSVEKLNEHYKASQNVHNVVAGIVKVQKRNRENKERAMESRQDEMKRGGQDERSRKLWQIIAAKTERRQKRELKTMKKRARQADHGCGYPRQCIGKGGKTEADLYHEHYHVEQHPLEGEAYEQEKIDAADLCPTWFNRNFDNNSIPSTVARMS